ncbi:MAG TPA: oligosaccharide flippase family protein [Dehalococcoidia bacterium]|nr:oligosaccharide flippase family protein [Dehalococcoidia bacterium]
MTSERPAEARSQPLSGRFLFNINFVFVTSLTSNTIGFAVAILMARALGPDGRGATALYQAAVTLGYAFLNLGLSSAVFYFVARKELSGRQATQAGLSVTLGAAAITALGVLIAALLFDERLSERHIPYGLAILTVPAVIQLRLCEGLLRAEGRFGAMNALELGLPVSMLAFLGGTELLWGLTVPRAVWAWSLAFLPPLAVGYALLGREYWPRGLAPVSMLVKMARFGGQSQLGNLIQLLNYRLDVFLILFLVNTGGVGLYTVASSQTEGLWIIANSVAIVLLTNITSGDADNAARMTPITCRNTLLVTAVCALVAAAIAGLWIPVVFGSKYEDSVAAYIWLLPGTVALSGAKILAAYVFSRGRPMINTWISLATLIAGLPIEVTLISLFGVTGAAAGTSLSYVLTLFLTAMAYRRLSGGSIVEALVPQRSDVALYVDAVRSIPRRLKRRTVVEPGSAPTIEA